jgi:hypothetical protein
MVRVTLVANAQDDSGGPVTLEVAVASDEPADGEGDGDTPVDWEVLGVDPATGVVTLDLRAERSGGGDGRVYTVTITATDPSGNASTAAVEVRVPHSRGKSK